MIKRFLLICLFVVISIVLAAGGPSLPVSAQEGEEGDFTESFDNSELPGWEKAPEALVVDGVLRLNPGNFALHFGDYGDISLSIKIKLSQGGEAAVSYYFRENQRYALIVSTSGNVLLNKEQGGQPATLGEAQSPSIQADSWFTLKVVFRDGQHAVSVNEEELFKADDGEALQVGAFFLQAMGEGVVEFDDMVVQGSQMGGPPMEGEQPQEPGVPVEEPGVPGEAPGVPGEAPGVPGEAPAQPQVMSTPTPVTQASLLQEFFGAQSDNLTLLELLINLVLAAISAFALSRVYIHWGSSLSNRRKFAQNFMLVTITTAFIIMVVRSSIALSLGLVGALSITRFRTAVKEPEELSYLFLAIGLGIGLGDNQRLLTLIALAIAIAIIGLLRLFRQQGADVNLHLNIISRPPGSVALWQVMETLKPHCSKLKLLRFDENREALEISLVIEFKDIANLHLAKDALHKLSPLLEISFLDNRGIW